MKFLGCKLFEREIVALGKGNTIKYTVFENKRLFSIIFYHWNTVDQIRFHTHAFASIAFLLCGGYEERVLQSDGSVIERTVGRDKWLRPRFIPRNYCHSVGESKPNTWTMVLTGPWQKNWFEFFPDTSTWVQYAWGRRKVGKFAKLAA